MCCAAVLCALAVWPPAASAGNVVSGEIADARGDSIRIPGVAPNDLASFGVRYDDAGILSTWYSLHEWHIPDTTPRDEFVGAHVGRWSRHLQSCDITTDGAASFRTSLNHDAPVPWSWIDYSVAGWGGFRSLPTFPLPLPDVYEGWEFVMSDAGALAGRAYDCVTGVTLMGGGGDRGDVPVFCLGADGRVPCAGPPVAPPAEPAATTPAGTGTPGPAAPAAPAGPAGPAAPGAPALRPLTRNTARALTRRALARRFGRAFTQRGRAGFSLRCTLRGRHRATCEVAWRHGSRRYAGSVRITRRASGDAVAVRVSRRPASRGRASRAAGDERARGLPQRASAP